MTDAERELHIKHCGQLMADAYKRGDVAEARLWLDAQNQAIQARSSRQVARMESCYFADAGAADREALHGR